jgi:hypothetical protein
MKRALLIYLLIFIFPSLQAQEVVSAISKSGNVNIVKKVLKLPNLEIDKNSIAFWDENGNNKIDANERAYIYFVLKNTGTGEGKGLKVFVKEENGIHHLKYNSEFYIKGLEVGEERQIPIALLAEMDISNATANIRIKVVEPNGFNSNEINLEVETQAYKSPRVEIVSYVVTSKSSTILQRKDPFDIQVLVQNLGEGSASDVFINLVCPDNIFCISCGEDENFMIGTLEPGEKHIIEYELVTNDNYTASNIPLQFDLSEKFGKYAKSKTITLEIDQNVSPDKIIVQGKTEEKKIIQPASLTSKVDRNIPTLRAKNPNRIALIIGNENYDKTLNAEPKVAYARNDAQVFKEYAVKIFGIEKENIYILLDATSGQMNQRINQVVGIMKKLGGKGELIFYYAGHGLPDENSKAPYLIPVDVDASNLSSAIKLADVYRRLSETGAGRITIFLDACFSGKSRGEGFLAARRVAIKPKNTGLGDNMVIFSASSGKQSAFPYNEEKHGLFTYFLLKKLKNTRGNVTYGELADYLIDEVSMASMRINGMEQDPEVSPSENIRTEWRRWKIIR